MNITKFALIRLKWSKYGTNREMKNPVSSLYKRTYGIYIVPRLGLEPRCLAALVFETSASTYSAIWAKEVDNECNVGAKVQ